MNSTMECKNCSRPVPEWNMEELNAPLCNPCLLKLLRNIIETVEAMSEEGQAVAEIERFLGLSDKDGS